MLPNLEEITRRRKALGIRQIELARLVGVSRSTIAKVETGRLTPSYPVAKQIFDTLETLEKERMTGLKNVTVKQIHNTQIEFAYVSETIHDVWKRMEDKAYSQFPVKDGENIVGSVTERGINRMLMNGDPEKVKKLPVSAIMEEPFPTVSVGMPVAAIIGLLQDCQAVLTIEGSKVAGIVTNTDIGRVFGFPRTT